MKLKEIIIKKLGDPKIFKNLCGLVYDIRFSSSLRPPEIFSYVDNSLAKFCVIKEVFSTMLLKYNGEVIETEIFPFTFSWITSALIHSFVFLNKFEFSRIHF